MKLWEINELIIKAIEFGYDPETGEILDESALKELQMERDDKIEGLILYAKDLKAEAKAIHDEKEALDSREKAACNKAESILRYVQKILAGEKFKTSRCAVSYRKSDSVEITDLEIVPKEYINTKTLYTPDKKAIKEVLKAGGTVPGTRLDVKQNIQVK